MRVDLPTFGAPIIATSNPDLTLSDNLVDSISFSNSRIIFVTRSDTLPRSPGGISSSEKSIVTSIRDPASIKEARHSFTFLPIDPSKTLTACFLCASVSELIRSAKPSI